jgi:small neutral amino acid transporter SnatA (MarC family)
VRIVGGIILMRIGFSLFMPSAAGSAIGITPAGGDGDVAFVPLAMPLMFGPGAIATVLGMASLFRHPFAEVPSLIAIVAANLTTMGATYLFLAYADTILGRIGSATSTRRRALSAFLSPRWAWTDLPRRDGGDPDIFACWNALTGIVSH